MNKTFVVATVLTLFGNSVFSGDIGRVSSEYRLSITPSSITFSIWGLIYSLLIAVSTINVPSSLNQKYIITCLCNVFWLILWQNENILLSALTLLILTTTLGSMLMDIEDKFSLLSVALSVYFAWTLGATMLNVGSFIKKEYSEDVSYIIMIIYNILPFLVYRYNLGNKYAILGTIVWTSIGIRLNDTPESRLAIFSFLTSALMILLDFD